MRHRDARSTAIEPHDGAYVGQHQAAHPTTTQYIVGQTVGALVPGTAHAISGWVNIPPTTDTFSFQVSVTWRDVNKAAISSMTVNTHTGPTGGEMGAGPSHPDVP